MDISGSVTDWIDGLRAGEAIAAEKLWNAYFHRMVTLARNRLRGAAGAVRDEEDVAISAFRSFCLGVRNNHFPKLLDRDSLWPLLVAITANKAVDGIRRENRKKRSGDKHVAVALDQIIANTPTPAQIAEMEHAFQRLLTKLGDDQLKSVALWKMEGQTVAEIAARLGCVPRTVERKLKTIRLIWSGSAEGNAAV